MQTKAVVLYYSLSGLSPPSSPLAAPTYTMRLILRGVFRKRCVFPEYCVVNVISYSPSANPVGAMNISSEGLFVPNMSEVTFVTVSSARLRKVIPTFSSVPSMRIREPVMRKLRPGVICPSFMLLLQS